MLEETNEVTFQKAVEYIKSARNYESMAMSFDGNYKYYAVNREGAKVIVAEYLPDENIHTSKVTEKFLVHCKVLEVVQHRLDI